MPTRALSACSAPGCSALLLKPGRCGAHARKPWAHTLTRHERGYNSQHERDRASALAREPLCYLCHTKPSTTMDHEVPLAEGGTNDPTNHRGACKDCQQVKASREGARARARARSNRLNP